jgi:SAM-dependent methyltransferase
MNSNKIAVGEFCSSCGSANCEQIFSLEQVPVNCGTLYNSVDKARNATRGEIDLSACRDCGLVFNRKYDVDLIEFGDQYEVSLGESQVFKDFQLNIARRLSENFSLKNKNVLEIGCGNGEFLELLCRVAGCDGEGIDPTAKRDGVNLGDNKISFQKAKFTPESRCKPFDFACCLSMFEDVPNISEFLCDLRNRIGDRPVGMYFEIFNGMRPFEFGEVWSIHYEQCNYFSMESFQNAFRANGFSVVNSGLCYQGDQYLFAELRPSPDDKTNGTLRSKPPVSEPKSTCSSDRVSQFQNFRNKFDNRKAFWNKRLDLTPTGKTFFWGAGGKAITFLNSVSASTKIEFVVDINPKRQGKYIPGTGQKIISPKDLIELKPENIIISNAIYRDEIRQMLSELGLNCSVDVA